MKPVVLVTPDVVYMTEFGRPFYHLKRSYSLALSGAGAAPLIAADALLYSEYAERADGLVISDSLYFLNPGRYGKSIDPESGLSADSFPAAGDLDSMELLLCKAFIAAKKPVLGIGRGMQIINVALGGTLKILLSEDQRKLHESFEEHRVKIFEGSKLYRALGPEIKGVSAHRQCVDRLGEGLTLAAVSEDGVPEAVEHGALPVFGVQWNAECFGTDDLAMYDRHKNATAPAPEADDATKKLKRKMLECKTAVPEFQTGFDIRRPEDNAVFNYFVSLCRGGRTNG